MGSGRKEMGISMKFVRHNTHSTERAEKKKKGSAQGNLCRRQIQNTCPARGREKEARERERDGILRGSNQLFIYCLLLVCFSFHCVSFHLPLGETTQQTVRPFKWLWLCVVTTSVTAQVTGNNFISFYAYHLRSLSRKIFLALFLPIPISSSNYTHTASVSIVLNSRSD